MVRELASPPFPVDGSVSQLADWAELEVLQSGKPMSRGKVATTLQRELGNAGQSAAADVWAELQYRGKLFADRWVLAAGDDQLVMSALGKKQGKRLLYYFLCALSLGEDIESGGRVLFELFVTNVSNVLTNNEVLRIGHPAVDPMPSSFCDRVDMYAKRSKENLLRSPPVTDKDMGTDIASWLEFRDSREGSLHFLGQCATGKNWDSKLEDLRVAWWRDHINWAVEPVRFFAIPHVVDRGRWRRVSQAAGLVLDRPRLIALASQSCWKPKMVRDIRDYCATLYL